MARILFDQAEIDVSEDVQEVLGRVVNSRDGLRRPNGSIIAPSGWVVLTEAITDKQVFVQVARIGYVCDG
jgi:hypothetical protein